jgi:hypothetical protein
MLDFALLLVAGLCQLALAILGFWPSARPPKKTFVLIGLIGVGAIIWSGVRSGKVQGIIADGVQKIEAKLHVTPQGDETEVFFQCEWSLLPKLMPASGELFIYQTNSVSSVEALRTFGGGALGKMFGPAGSELRWSNDNTKQAIGEKCELFNYGSGPIFDVVLTFDVALQNAIPQGSGSQTGGEIAGTGKWIVPISKVDEGRSNPFEFYFFNRYWPYFIQINPTPSATFIRSSNADRQTVKVISSAHDQPIFLDPGDVK